MKKISLKVPSSAAETVVPRPIHIREITGSAHPVPSFGNATTRSAYVDVIPPIYDNTNVGRYVPPPKPPIWTEIPTSVLPKKPCGKC